MIFFTFSSNICNSKHHKVYAFQLFCAFGNGKFIFTWNCVCVTLQWLIQGCFTFFVEPVIEKQETLGEVLNGDRLMSSLYDLKFKEDKTHAVLCHKRLTSSDIARFRDTIAQDFYFQMYYDDLPLWGFVGKVERDYSGHGGEENAKYYLFNHLNFNVLYNADEVIAIQSLSDPSYMVDISENAEIDVRFTYSVSWNLTSERSETRMDKYSQASLHPISKKIHYFSFLNSISVVVLVVGLLSLLFMRHLKNELRR